MYRGLAQSCALYCWTIRNCYRPFFSILEDDDLPFLFRRLHSLAPRWFGFCLQLGVKDLEQIERNGTSVDDRLVLALQDWLRACDVSWRKLIEAIFRPSGGGHQVLASDVAKSFQGTFVASISNPLHTFIMSMPLMSIPLSDENMWQVFC